MTDVEAVELHRARLPLRRPIVAAHGLLHERAVLFVRVLTAAAEGWGECGALLGSAYTDEDLDGAEAAIRQRLVPALLAGSTLDAVAPGHPMATAAVATAILDATLRSEGRSLAQHLGALRDRVPAGAALGLAPHPDETAAQARDLVEAGYRRIRLKIAPGRDVAVVEAVRGAVGPGVALLADANASYAAMDAAEAVHALRPLECLGLTALEQPLAAGDLVGHADLARRLAVPIGLDESVTSLAALSRILDLGAASVICVKVAHLGGYEAARAAAALCEEAGVGAFVGGMFDTAVARTANAALAAVAGFTIAGDVGPPSVYLAADVAMYPELAPDGTVPVWQEPGVGPIPNLVG